MKRGMHKLPGEESIFDLLDGSLVKPIIFSLDVMLSIEIQL